MKKIITRRKFFIETAGAGTGAFIVPSFFGSSMGKSGNGITPLIMTSHTNETGRNAMEAGWKILKAGGNAVDAVEKAANVIEVDPEDTSVGYGGLPNERGVVQLDASFMDGKTYSAGAVACLENIKTPASVAKLVMQRTDHVLLVGAGALEFAKAWGFNEENLLTEKARKIWLRWKEELSPSDDWGAPEHLQNIIKKESYWKDFPDIEHHYGTTNVLAIDSNGDIAGCTTTSGLAFKLNGRIGDSPIIGAGLFVDNEAGAATSSGTGEEVIRICGTHLVVEFMRQGYSPEAACRKAVERIVKRDREKAKTLQVGFLAMNKKGQYGAYAIQKGFVFSVKNNFENKIHDSKYLI